jgi:hypothetical protein
MSNPSSTLRGALCAAALLLAAGPLSAGLVTLDTSNPNFDDDRLNNGDTATDGNILLTFGSVLNGAGGSAVFVDSDGISLGFDDLDAVSFSIVFDTDTIIDAYTVDFETTGSSGGGFQLNGFNGTSGLNDLSSVGTFSFNMGSIPYFAAGQSYGLTHSVIGRFNYSQLKSLQISEADVPAPVPAPATALLLAGGFIGLRTLRRAPRRA